jgi:hypothetical protein
MPGIGPGHFPFRLLGRVGALLPTFPSTSEEGRVLMKSFTCSSEAISPAERRIIPLREIPYLERDMQVLPLGSHPYKIKTAALTESILV